MMPPRLHHQKGWLTVLWTEDGVSLVRWAPWNGKALICEQNGQLPPAQADAGGYLEALHRLVPAGERFRYRVRWLVLVDRQQAGPAGSPAEPGIPEWMTACWESLPVLELPAAVHCPVACLEGHLRQWPEFQENGTGVFLPLDRKGVFLALGQGKVFRRITRFRPHDLQGDADAAIEWIRQTGLLFHNRTGAELKRILLPGETAVHPDLAGDSLPALIPGLRPPAWQFRPSANLPASHLFAHASGVRLAGTEETLLPIPLLEKRRHLRQWDLTLRTGACLLLGGWILLLQGACDHYPRGKPETPLHRAWQAEVATWHASALSWKKQRERTAVQEAPHRIIHSVSMTAPEELALYRVRVNRADADGDNRLHLHIEGGWSDGEAAPILREWIARLQESDCLQEVSSLRFERAERAVRFFLDGVSSLNPAYP